MTCPFWTLFGVLQSLFWVWLHLLQFCIANQLVSVAEDQHNKPWRPVPAGLISSFQASILRWSAIIACIILSSFRRAHTSSNVIIAMTFLYNDLGLHSHWASKNVATAIGYMAFNQGALLCLGMRITGTCYYI